METSHVHTPPFGIYADIEAISLQGTSALESRSTNFEMKCTWTPTEIFTHNILSFYEIELRMGMCGG